MEKSLSQARDFNAPMVNGNGRAAKPRVTVEDEDESPTKKRKAVIDAPPVGLSVEEMVVDVQIGKDRSPIITRPAEIIEPGGDAPWSPMSSAAPSPFLHTSSPVSPMKTAFGVKTSAPRKPSRLRESYRADKETASAEEQRDSPPPAPLLTSRILPTETPATSPKAKLPAKDAVAAMDIDELPTFTFAFGEAAYPAGPSHVKARSAAAAMSPLSLPTFEFKLVAAPTNGFNWTAAGMKAPAASASSTWSCNMCMLANPDSAKDKCTICDAPRPSKVADTPPTKAFDWSKAAIKPPASSAGTWKCNTCMLSNPDSARLKCVVCDAPRPDVPAS